jgi:hypothetical protein
MSYLPRKPDGYVKAQGPAKPTHHERQGSTGPVDPVTRRRANRLTAERNDRVAGMARR